MLFYEIKCYSTNKNDQKSLDFVVNKFIFKVRTSIGGAMEKILVLELQLMGVWGLFPNCWGPWPPGSPSCPHEGKCLLCGRPYQQLISLPDLAVAETGVLAGETRGVIDEDAEDVAERDVVVGDGHVPQVTRVSRRRLKRRCWEPTLHLAG